MRGKEADGSVNFDTKRITPAYAGKRSSLTPRQNGTRDHPRLCGEKTAPTCPASSFLGSPPPMRGKDSH